MVLTPSFASLRPVARVSPSQVNKFQNPSFARPGPVSSASSLPISTKSIVSSLFPAVCSANFNPPTLS